jgi:hypothetical protein
MIKIGNTSRYATGCSTRKIKLDFHGALSRLRDCKLLIRLDRSGLKGIITSNTLLHDCFFGFHIKMSVIRDMVYFLQDGLSI